MGSIAKKMLEELKENVGEWSCGFCNSGSNQPAAIFREIKKMGYLFEEVSPNRWGRTMFCPVCNQNRTHYRLLSVTPLVDEKPRCTITTKQRERVLRLLKGRDAFSGASITSTAEVDHKKPWSRLDQDIDIATLTDDQVKEHFQLLTREHNLLKDRACQHCIKSGKRPPLFGISFWYAGDETYNDTCVGCGWYDGEKWKMELNNLLNSL